MHVMPSSLAALLVLCLLSSCSAGDGASTPMPEDIASEPVDVDGPVTRLRITDCSGAEGVLGDLVAGLHLVPVPFPEGQLVCGWLGSENSPTATFSLQVEFGSVMPAAGIPGYQTVPAPALERRGGITQIKVDADTDANGGASVDFRVFLPDAQIMLIQHLRGGGEQLSPERSLEIVDALVEV